MTVGDDSIQPQQSSPPELHVNEGGDSQEDSSYQTLDLTGALSPDRVSAQKMSTSEEM